MDSLSLPEQVALVVAVVATLRVQFPKVLDGWRAVLLALAVAVGVAAVLAPDATFLPAWVRQGVLLFFYAVGGVSLAKSVGRHIWQREGGEKRGGSAE